MSVSSPLRIKMFERKSLVNIPEELRKDFWKELQIDFPKEPQKELREELQKRAITNLILPEDAAAADPGLVADLMRSSVPQEAATKIARALSRESSRLAKEVAAFKAKENGSRNQADTQVCFVRHKHSFDVMLGRKSKKILKLNVKHHDKLKELFRRHTQQHRSRGCGSGMLGSQTPRPPASEASPEGLSHLLQEGAPPVVADLVHRVQPEPEAGALW